jgi:undecaprenyl-diphosphatase
MVARSMPTWAEWLARPFTWVGGVVGLTVVVLAAVTWLLRRRAPDVAVLLLGVTIGIELIVVAAKNGYDRPRPDVGSAIALPSSFSFPSGHAASGVAVLGLLGLIAGRHARSRRTRVAAIVAGFGTGILVGLSRVVLDVHYLSDVVAGACLGLAWLTACLLTVRGVDAYRARNRSRAG